MGVAKTATAAEIKAAYRKLAVTHHPDRNRGKTKVSSNIFVEIAAAYETLSDPEKRRHLDDSLRERVKPVAPQAPPKPARPTPQSPAKTVYPTWAVRIAAAVFALIVFGAAARWIQKMTAGGNYISDENAPVARYRHSVVFGDDEIIVFGGMGNNGYLGNGAVYNFDLGEWRAISSVGAPSARDYHVAVWTGKKMMVWGGDGPGLNEREKTMYEYDPLTDSWDSFLTDREAGPSMDRMAFWTGNEMFVWWGGGFDGNKWNLSEGYIFNPGTRTWRSVTKEGRPMFNDFVAVWTGMHMLVWGIRPTSAEAVLVSYDLRADKWLEINMALPPYEHFSGAAWTGSEMIVWGQGGGIAVDPAGKKWRALPPNPKTNRRFGAPLVWGRNALIVWGGKSNGDTVSTGFVYKP